MVTISVEAKQKNKSSNDKIKVMISFLKFIKYQQIHKVKKEQNRTQQRSLANPRGEEKRKKIIIK